MTKRVYEEFADFEAKLSLSNPIEDYMELIEGKMKADVIMTNEVYYECWRKISAAAREIIWKMLFEESNPPKIEQLEKAAELLRKLKKDACIYEASEYNKWIVLVRDELLKRKMFDFWKNEIVKKELGPCWARDSDLFDDTEDPEPANFYKYADCEAPFVVRNKSIQTYKLSVDTPLLDYKYIVKTLLYKDVVGAYEEIFAEAREMIWNLLFGETSLTAENSEKAAELLEEYKKDACFSGPDDYNDWIPKLKDELIKRKYLNFWQNVVVKKELGLCWAKDSDYFDDMEDPKPLEFYKVNEEAFK